MPRLTATFLAASGTPLVDTPVFFRRLSSPSADAIGDLIPIDGTVVYTTNDAGEIHEDSDGVPAGIPLAPGRWLVTWTGGVKPSRLIIELPDDSATHALKDVLSSLGGAYGLIYWGRSTQPLLTGADVADLEQQTGRTSINGTYPFGAGSGYCFFAWPDTMRPPTPGTGFWDTATDLPAIMAGFDDGYDETSNGWCYRLISVSGTAYRLYRTRRELAGSVSLRIS